MGWTCVESIRLLQLNAFNNKASNRLLFSPPQCGVPKHLLQYKCVCLSVCLFVCLSVCLSEALKTFRPSSLLLQKHLDVAASFADGAVNGLLKGELMGELPPPGGSSVCLLLITELPHARSVNFQNLMVKPLFH